MMKADIFIPTSNRIDSLSQCLNSLRRQTVKDFRVLLVGICKKQEIDDLVGMYGELDIVYFIQGKPGLIGAANEALAKSENEIFIRIDDDVVLDPAWYENVISTFQSSEQVGGVTGPTLMTEEGLKARDLTAFLEKFKHSKNPFLGFLYHLYNDYLYEKNIYQVSRFLESGVFTLGSNYPQCLSLLQLVDVDNLEACNWSCRTALLKRIGGFDEIYLKGLGDYHEADAALKLKKLGYRLVFNHKAKLEHRVEIGVVQKARPAAYYRIQNFIIFYFRFFRIQSLSQLAKLSLNVALQNGYYFYRFLTTGAIGQLGSLPGTLVGLLRVGVGQHKIKKVS